ncbi:hypothetical protein [Streptomyces sp. CA-111067]|uniref:hypothetical protein n=1 Tax=Streptomyces sp. CA-111067 TaxID=3240046 RepID=UPI003D993C54
MDGRGQGPAYGRDGRRRVRRGGRGGALAVALLAAATAVTALTGAAPAGAGGTAGKSAAHPPGWQSRQAAGPRRDEELRAVAARGPGDAWSAGYREEPSGLDVPVAEHFDGFGWHATAGLGHLAGGTRIGQLDDVLPLRRTDVWAVGSWNDQPAHQDRSLAEHWDGRAWREVALPAEPADRSAYPSALAGVRRDDVWAVGTTAQDRIGTPKPLAYHWNGRAWSSVATPEPGGDALLLDAAADGRGTVWAVGTVYDAQGAGRPLTERWDGRSWRIVPAPHTAGRGESLESVAVLAPDDVWAVGVSSTPDGTPRPLALHWNGRTWSAVAVPDVPVDLHAVTAYGRHVLIALGERQGAATPAYTMRWDGGRWLPEPAATDPAGAGASLFGVAAVPHPHPGGPSAWAVGSTLPRFDPPWRPIVQAYTTGR